MLSLLTWIWLETPVTGTRNSQVAWLPACTTFGVQDRPETRLGAVESAVALEDIWPFTVDPWSVRVDVTEVPLSDAVIVAV